MNPTVTMWLVFASGTLCVLVIWSILRDVSRSDRRRVRKRLRSELGLEAAETQALFKNLNAMGSDPFSEDQEPPRGLLPGLVAILEQSGLDVTPEMVLMRSLLAAGALGLMALALTGRLWFALPFVAVGFAGPIGYYFHKRRQRQEKFSGQLADAFSLMARVLRAGQTLPQAMTIVSTEFTDPISGEFALCQEQQNLGLRTDAALRELARRTGLTEIRMFVVANLVHRESGGNFADLLENLSQVVRERFRIRGMVQSLTAEGRMQAAVLLILPLVLYFLLSLLNPGYFAIVLERHPEWIAEAFLAELLGALWIRKIINFDF